MPAKVDAGEVTRTECLLIAPEHIKLGINVRWTDPDDHDVESLCLSFEKEGQKQDITVRKLPDRTVELVFGYHRRAAALLFNQRHPDSPMKLRCRVIECNAEEAIVSGIIENHERKATTPMDDAFAQRKLREDYGWDNPKIAELYHIAKSYVYKLSKLLSLPKKIQLQVHQGKISVAAAIELLAIPENEHDAILSSQEPQVSVQNDDEGQVLPTPSKSPESSPVRNGTPVATVNEKIATRAREKAVEEGKKKGRSIGEAKKFFQALLASEETPTLEPIAKLMVRFFEGAIVDKTMTKKLLELFPTQEKPDES